MFQLFEFRTWQRIASQSRPAKRLTANNTPLHADQTSKGEVTGSLIAHQSLNFSSIGVIPTALVPIEDDSSTITICRAMIDSGSRLSLITESAVQRMQLKRRRH